MMASEQIQLSFKEEEVKFKLCYDAEEVIAEENGDGLGFVKNRIYTIYVKNFPCSNSEVVNKNNNINICAAATAVKIKAEIDLNNFFEENGALPRDNNDQLLARAKTLGKVHCFGEIVKSRSSGFVNDTRILYSEMLPLVQDAKNPLLPIIAGTLLSNEYSSTSSSLATITYLLQPYGQWVYCVRDDKGFESQFTSSSSSSFELRIYLMYLDVSGPTPIFKVLCTLISPSFRLDHIITSNSSSNNNNANNSSDDDPRLSPNSMTASFDSLSPVSNVEWQSNPKGEGKEQIHASSHFHKEEEEVEETIDDNEAANVLTYLSWISPPSSTSEGIVALSSAAAGEEAVDEQEMEDITTASTLSMTRVPSNTVIKRTTLANSEEAIVNETTIKKGRGRPRKNAVISVAPMFSNAVGNRQEEDHDSDGNEIEEMEHSCLKNIEAPPAETSSSRVFVASSKAHSSSRPPRKLMTVVVAPTIRNEEEGHDYANEDPISSYFTSPIEKPVAATPEQECTKPMFSTSPKRKKRKQFQKNEQDKEIIPIQSSLASIDVLTLTKSMSSEDDDSLLSKEVLASLKRVVSCFHFHLPATTKTNTTTTTTTESFTLLSSVDGVEFSEIGEKFWSFCLKYHRYIEKRQLGYDMIDRNQRVTWVETLLQSSSSSSNQPKTSLTNRFLLYLVQEQDDFFYRSVVFTQATLERNVSKKKPTVTEFSQLGQFALSQFTRLYLSYYNNKVKKEVLQDAQALELLTRSMKKDQVNKKRRTAVAKSSLDDDDDDLDSLLHDNSHINDDDISAPTLTHIVS